MDTLENFWTLESVWTLWKIYGHSGKLFGHSGKFKDTMECLRNLLKVFGHSGKFQESLESFRTLWKVSGHSGCFGIINKNVGNSEKLLKPLKMSSTFCKASRLSKKFYVKNFGHSGKVTDHAVI